MSGWVTQLSRKHGDGRSRLLKSIATSDRPSDLRSLTPFFPGACRGLELAYLPTSTHTHTQATDKQAAAISHHLVHAGKWWLVNVARRQQRERNSWCLWVHICFHRKDWAWGKLAENLNEDDQTEIGAPIYPQGVTKLLRRIQLTPTTAPRSAGENIFAGQIQRVGRSQMRNGILSRFSSTRVIINRPSQDGKRTQPLMSPNPLKKTFQF